MSHLDYHLGNPAGRLWHFMQSARTSPNPTEPLAVFLYRYFDIPQAGPFPLNPRVFAAMQHLFLLPDNIEQAVHRRQSPTPPAEVLLRPLTNVRNTFMQFVNLNVALNSVNAHFTDADVSELEHCSYYLGSEDSGSPALRGDDLQKIRELADELVDIALTSEDLDPDVKNLIWENATKIADAVRLVRAAGAGALKSSLNEAIGDLVRNPAAQHRLLQDRGGAGKKFFELLQKMTVVVALVQGPLAIAADTADLLQVGQSDTKVVVIVDSSTINSPVNSLEPNSLPAGQ